MFFKPSGRPGHGAITFPLTTTCQGSQAHMAGTAKISLHRSPSTEKLFSFCHVYQQSWSYAQIFPFNKYTLEGFFTYWDEIIPSTLVGSRQAHIIVLCISQLPMEFFHWGGSIPFFNQVRLKKKSPKPQYSVTTHNPMPYNELPGFYGENVLQSEVSVTQYSEISFTTGWEVFMKSYFFLSFLFFYFFFSPRGEKFSMASLCHQGRLKERSEGNTRGRRAGKIRWIIIFVSF